MKPIDRHRPAVDPVSSPNGSKFDISSSPPTERQETGRLRLVVEVCALLAGISAGTGLLGWIVDSTTLKQVIPGLAVVSASTAIALLLLTLTWFVPHRLGIVCATLVVVIAVLVLGEYATRTNFGIDQLLFSDHGGGRYPGRPSVVSSSGFGLLGAARLLAYGGRVRWAQMIALLVLMVGSLTVLGYAYDVQSLYRLRPFASVALHTALGLVLLSVAALASVDDGALSWAARGTDAGAELLRRLLPLALLGLPLIGFGTLVAQRLDWVDGSSTIALLVVVSALTVGLLTWAAALRLTRVDRRRVRAIAQLTDLKNDLEHQVQERVDQLQRRRDEIAVLEDRQRIAADLHDIVIQRLFAAGMFLQGTPVEETDPETLNRVNTAVEAMDTAIKDLRASIFELGRRTTALVDLTTAIDNVCEESTRILGFRPDVTVDDPELAADEFRADLLAVVREALANVARHAQASRAEVTIRAENQVLTLSIIDDGRGMNEASSRTSGTRNMTERARQLGGECRWLPAEPHGTHVCWQVPMPVRVD